MSVGQTSNQSESFAAILRVSPGAVSAARER